MDEEADEVEQQDKQLEYGIWRQNAAFLYGVLRHQQHVPVNRLASAVPRANTLGGPVCVVPLQTCS